MLIVAPHPDDDVIAAGGLIQRTIAAGGSLRVLFLTAGERNEWAQRALLRKWRITDADRAGWARLRMEEAAAALLTLGAAADSFELLGLPDRGLARMARLGGQSTAIELGRRIQLFAPTLIAVPSSFDAHGDHRATAHFAHRAITEPARVVVTYVIHGRAPEARAVLTLHLSAAEQERKRQAITAHATQLVLGTGRFLSYARRTEIFYRSEEDCVALHSTARDAFDGIRHGMFALGNSMIGAIRRRVS